MSESSLINAGIELVNELKLEVSKLDADVILSVNQEVANEVLLSAGVYGLDVDVLGQA